MGAATWPLQRRQISKDDSHSRYTWGPRVPFPPVYLDPQGAAAGRTGHPRTPSLLPHSILGQETKDSLGKALGVWGFVLFSVSRQGYMDTGQMSSYFQEGQCSVEAHWGDFRDAEALLREGKAQIPHFLLLPEGLSVGAMSGSSGGAKGGELREGRGHPGPHSVSPNSGFCPFAM